MLEPCDVVAPLVNPERLLDPIQALDDYTYAQWSEEDASRRVDEHTRTKVIAKARERKNFCDAQLRHLRSCSRIQCMVLAVARKKPPSRMTNEKDVALVGQFAVNANARPSKLLVCV
jgi:hypothetical protein